MAQDSRATAARPAVLLPFVLVSFAANSLITRYVVRERLLEAGLVSAARFLAGAATLTLLALALGERPRVGRANVLPALWLGIYAACISYGYQHIGAAAGTFVFYAAGLLTLVGHDLLGGVAVPRHRAVGAAVSLAGIAVLAGGSVGDVTVLGVVLLTATGAMWGLYTVAGRAPGDPRAATTGHFLLLGAVVLVPAAVAVGAGAHTSLAGLAWAAGMGAGPTAGAYVAWYACQRVLPGTTAGTVQLAIPVLTTVGAVLLLGERLSWGLLAAAVLVAAGMWLARPGR